MPAKATCGLCTWETVPELLSSLEVFVPSLVRRHWREELVYLRDLGLFTLPVPDYDTGEEVFFLVDFFAALAHETTCTRP